MVAKVAGGIIGLGLIGTGSVAMAKPEWFGINKEITWKPLSQDSDFSDSSNGYSDKFGGKHKNYLVGVKGNQDWWKESFERLKEDSKNQNTDKQPSSKFKYTNDSGTVTNGFVASGGNDENKALNQICKKVYKSETTNIDATGTSNDHYKEADVWKYCSPLGSKPKTIKEANETTTKYTPSGGGELIGKAEETNLISVFNNSNDKFWEIRQQEFYGERLFKDEASKVTVPATDKFFAEEKGKKTHIKKICELAYEKDSTNTASPSTTSQQKTKPRNIAL